ncbi:MAG: bifunctional phosphoserine phosphatase/homoserine phosphotransferase ThrH [Acidimicrobiales bacterium]|nr:bifunctional phosphoserine phosphatase/homoserine phosphotransferase ThrH [Acidimicrobiales bacterium]
MPAEPAPQFVVVLDVEGVLTPEIWIAVADRFGADELRRTTKDEPDYAKLMQGRIDTLAGLGLGLSDIQGVIAQLEPLDGAKDFLDRLRSVTQVVLLSDTFEEFIGPLMAKLGFPTILCHRLQVVDDRIVGFVPRIENQKMAAVHGFQAMNYRVVAAGDSFNDLNMIDAADAGFLFRSPPAIVAQRSDLAAFETYDELFCALTQVINAS